jgi:hypothetical protein
MQIINFFAGESRRFGLKIGGSYLSIAQPGAKESPFLKMISEGLL